MTLDARLFQNPERQLERKQDISMLRPCSGCKHWDVVWGTVLCRKHIGRVGRNVQVCGDFCRKGKA